MTADDDDGQGDGSSPPRALLVADAHFAGGSVALADALDRLRDATVVPTHHTVAASGARTLYCSVADASREAVEEAFAHDPTVDDAAHLAAFPERSTHRLRLADDAVLVAPTSLELGARTQSVRGHDGRWNARVQFPDREALVALRQFCTERGIRFGIDSLYRTDDGTGGRTDLTDAQRTALLTALELGYFDVPRRATQDDLAAELGISTSAVSHRLRRATAQLVRESFEEADESTDSG